jgi:hypothetical protein
MSLTVAVDFDGTIHPYTNGWTGEIPDDEPPIEGAVFFLHTLKELKYRVVIFSARASTMEGHQGILNWLIAYDLKKYVDDITFTKPYAVAYVDDRSVVYRDCNWADCIAAIEELSPKKKHNAAS